MNNEEAFVNTVSHGMSIVDKQALKDAFTELGVTVDVSEGNVLFDYTNAKISVRIDSDGYIRKGTWSHNLDIKLENIIFVFDGLDVTMDMVAGFTHKTKTGSIF